MRAIITGLFALLLFRLLSSVFIVTHFNPDEYWQSMEVGYYHATHSAYPGSPSVFTPPGALTWEYHQVAKIRSYIHPAIICAIYKILIATGLDTRFTIAYAPRFLHSLFACVCDLYLYKLSKKYFGSKIAKVALFCHLLNWFTVYCLVRSYSNSIECAITTLALYYWPINVNVNNNNSNNSNNSNKKKNNDNKQQTNVMKNDDNHKHVNDNEDDDNDNDDGDSNANVFHIRNRRQFFQVQGQEGQAEVDVGVGVGEGDCESEEERAGSSEWEKNRAYALILAAVSVVIRPTSAVLWFLLGVDHLLLLFLSSSSSSSSLNLVYRLIFKTVIPIAIISLSISLIVDSIGYGTWTLSAFNFLHFNTIADVSKLYGVHPFHWYFSSGFPVMLGPLLPLFVLACFQFLCFPFRQCSSASSLASSSSSSSSSSSASPSASLSASSSITSSSSFGSKIASLYRQFHEPGPYFIAVIVLVNAIYSINAHKEFRFVFPVLPLASMLCGVALVSLMPQSSSRPSSASSTSSSSSSFSFSSSRLFRCVIVFLCVSNGGLIYYFCRVHQVGTIAIFDVLASLDPLPRQVHFWMPCHSTPLYTYLHIPNYRAMIEKSSSSSSSSSHGDGPSPLLYSPHLLYLDCSPLFVNMSLSGDGTNRCSPDAQFRRNAKKTFMKTYKITETTTTATTRTALKTKTKQNEKQMKIRERGQRELDQSKKQKKEEKEEAEHRTRQANVKNEETDLNAFDYDDDDDDDDDDDNKRQAANDDDIDECSSVSYPHADADAFRLSSLGGGSMSSLSSSLPSHIVIFDYTKEELHDVLTTTGYKLIARIFHSHFDDAKHVLLYEKQNWLL